MYIGVDIVDIERIKMAIERTPRFLGRIFTPNEISYSLRRNNPYPSLAARFAAKEAFRKLHPLFTRGIAFHDVEVVNDLSGRPHLYLHRKADQLKKEAGLFNLAISISHAQYHAIATIIAQGKGDGNEGCKS
ncbi:MAG TPA: holo-ACP synthase [Syntrophomonadaceae bacterium]|nr:holo-ACP synthase [Syntrophomonadaceae bacterium]